MREDGDTRRPMHCFTKEKGQPPQTQKQTSKLGNWKLGNYAPLRPSTRTVRLSPDRYSDPLSSGCPRRYTCVCVCVVGVIWQWR